MLRQYLKLLGRYRRRVDLATRCVLGGLSVLSISSSRRQELLVKYALILFIIATITQIVLIIVAAYFIFRTYSCVYTISPAFEQFCALQVCIRSYLNRILICNRSLQIPGDHPIEYVERNVKILFYFSLFVKCKKYS